MAGLYVVLGNSEPKRIDAAAERLTFFSNQENREIFVDDYWSYSLVSLNNPKHFGSACDPKSGVRVVTSGRIAWPASDWLQAEQMNQYQGGLSNRLILHQYLNKGIAGVERHNGSAILLIWDPRLKELHLLTDHFGYHPIFLYRPDNIKECVISTFPDAIADDEQVRVEPDYVSMTDFLRAWRITPPHTYYKEIKYAGAAVHWCWNFATGAVKHRYYWQPFQDAPFSSLNEAVEELTQALKNSIHIRTLPHLCPVVSYTSGGLDSRSVLFSAADRYNLVGVNLYDQPNKESAIAQRLCEAAGVKYVGFQRDPDYYPRWMQEGARLSGGMWSLEDNHFLGTREFITAFNPQTVLTACTSDWLFKGYGLEKQYQQFFGKNLPTLEFTNERVDGFLPNYPRQSPPEFALAVRERMLTWFEGTPQKLTTDKERLLVEDKRIRPACYAVSVSSQIMHRIFPYDTFLADTRVADCYSRSRAEWKLNGDLWGLTIANLCQEGENIVDANFGWKVGSSYWQKLLMFGVNWLKRRASKQNIIQGLATEGSWPNLSWYVNHSDTIKDFWYSRSLEDKQLISTLWGEDCWSISLEDLAKDPNSLFRILTLLNHWQSRRSCSKSNSIYMNI
ncbi:MULTISPECIES: hypothetical protein [Calothrix]|uniref:asparagine synthase (glutamine-hydrolyzing) n=2 Tax=Calothrix TaxID=1186 RepID=A0ABR8ALV9_9CYAN|nr:MULTISPECIES: hypothetical protein [Calothrix]MBD2200794.1 hypothetical protein [Calothrix parietina FACHB-288]MBD2229823.1 hypothetical protein [Calothrix anomala FACHB-343]